MSGRAVHVIATTEEGTERALKTAGQLAREQGTGVVVVVPQVTSFASSPQRPAADPRPIIDLYRSLAAATGVNATVRVCLCRQPKHVFGRLLVEHAQVVVGGRRRRWWPSREERLARSLADRGHRVTFADVASAPA